MNRTDIYGENYKATNIVMALLIDQINKYENIRSILDERYHEIYSKIDQYGIIDRKTEDLHLSIWTEDDRLIKIITKLSLPHFEWNRWQLEEHPIIKFKKSPYKDGFPWNLRKKVAVSKDLSQSRLIASRRVSLQIPLDDNTYKNMLSLL